MTVALVLLGYAVLLAVAGPRLLTGAAWTDRAPRLAITAWQSLMAAVVGAVVLGGLALVVPTGPVSAGLAELLRACLMKLRAQYATPGGAAVGATGAVLAFAVLGRLGYCLIASLRGAARERLAYRQALTLTGQARPDIGAVILASAAPAVYCLPGRRRRIVVTRGALDLLDDAQLAAALAHERAHLDQRHDLVIGWAAALTRAFPRIGLFARGLAESRRLVELLADDTATRRVDRLTLADALLALAGGRTPAGALGAAGDAAARVRRLIAPGNPLSIRSRVGAVLAALAAFTVPMIVVATPAIAATQMSYCL